MSGAFGFKTLDRVDLFIDSNEASMNKEAYDELRRRGFRVAVRRLDAGDFLIPATGECEAILIERKTIDDFLTSIIDGRLWSQLSRLSSVCREYNAKCILLLEGSVERALRRRKIHPSAYMRALETVQESFNTIVVLSIDKKTSIDWITARIKHCYKKKSGEAKVQTIAYQPRKSSFKNLNEKIIYVASVIAGRETGLKLLKHFGTLRNLANASIHELLRIEGVGESRAKEVYYIFNKNVGRILREEGK